jgi:hypothetical protein
MPLVSPRENLFSIRSLSGGGEERGKEKEISRSDGQSGR